MPGLKLTARLPLALKTRRVGVFICLTFNLSRSKSLWFESTASGEPSVGSGNGLLFSTKP
jgi:hypothetical protein